MWAAGPEQGGCGATCRLLAKSRVGVGPRVGCWTSVLVTVSQLVLCQLFCSLATQSNAPLSASYRVSAGVMSVVCSLATHGNALLNASYCISAGDAQDAAATGVLHRCGGWS